MAYNDLLASLKSKAAYEESHSQFKASRQKKGVSTAGGEKMEERKWGLLPESVPLHVISTVDRSLRSFFQLLTNDKETMLAYFNSLRDGLSERKPQAFPSLWTTVSMIT